MILAVGYALSGLIVVLGPFRGRRDLPSSRTGAARRAEAGTG